MSIPYSAKNHRLLVEGRIKQVLLEFKFWVDDPFFVDGSFNPLDHHNIRAGREARGEGGRILIPR